MKICFLAHAAKIHTRRWVRYFREQGHQVSLVSLTPAEPEPGIACYILPCRWRVSYERTNWHYLLQLPRLWKIVREIQPDLLNAHFLSSYGVLGALIRPRHCPLVISLYGSDILLIPRKSFLHHWAASFALRQADMVISVAQHMTHMLSTYIDRNTPLLTLQYGVDTRSFFPPAPFAPRAPVCLSNRAMVSTSNLETLLGAACVLKNQHSRLRIHLAGDGEQSTVLRKKAAALQLDDWVSFLGRVDHIRMPELLRAAALYVSTSHSDGASLSLLEAMACGTFPVAANIPANREWITDGVNGYLVPPFSAAAFAEKLNAAWRQPELRRTAAVHNWALIREKGDYLINMSRVETAFAVLLLRKGIPQ
jgi:glycosyltransferase involved in cell wall biosynthesis